MSYDIKKYTNLALSILFLGVTSGCADRVSLAEQEMATIRSQPAQPIEPPPTPKVIEDYDYAANNVRSPFVPQSLIDHQAMMANRPSIRPDENRVKGELENYDLSQLVYRGNVVVNGQIHALILTPEGLVKDVKVGDYMGRNHGQIKNIRTKDEKGDDVQPVIELVEIVEDVKFGYVERAERLELTN